MQLKRYSFIFIKFLFMQILTKKICGIILLTIPSIIYGGYFLLTVLSGQEAELELTAFQQSMFRAGHAHAGVLVILSLVAQVLTDHANLSKGWEWMVRISFPLAAIAVSGGFFAAAIGHQLTQPNGMIVILYAGMVMLAVGLVTLGIGLIRANDNRV
jgi:hypothetical protein